MEREPGPPRVVCIGQALCDFCWHVDQLPHGEGKYRSSDFSHGLGGMAAIAAVTASRLGAKASLWGHAGADAVGDAVIDALRQGGIDTQWFRLFEGARSSVSAILVDRSGERMIVNQRSHGLPESVDWLPLNAANMGDVLLADPSWPAGAAAAMRAARQHGIATVLDGDGTDVAAIDSLLTWTDHALFSQAALALWSAANGLGDANIETRLLTLRARGCVVAAITQGAQGVLWADASGVHHQPAARIRAIDTTGAGDVFHGAYAFALASVRNPDEAIRIATAAAALKCSRGGGPAGIPVLAETLEFMTTHLN